MHNVSIKHQQTPLPVKGGCKKTEKKKEINKTQHSLRVYLVNERRVKKKYLYIYITFFSQIYWDKSWICSFRRCYMLKISSCLGVFLISECIKTHIFQSKQKRRKKRLICIIPNNKSNLYVSNNYIFKKAVFIRNEKWINLFCIFSLQVFVYWCISKKDSSICILFLSLKFLLEYRRVGIIIIIGCYYAVYLQMVFWPNVW